MYHFYKLTLLLRKFADEVSTVTILQSAQENCAFLMPQAFVLPFIFR